MINLIVNYHVRKELAMYCCLVCFLEVFLDMLKFAHMVVWTLVYLAGTGIAQDTMAPEIP